ncbi:hypothetical protein RHGRI_021118 [Rhododendron griersonianum]|uniref:Uncharacterized protein n=1 Tax=Rhododendron griersonianum TaxID=479676 RepID=A0AAV6JND3_9ERIC|nr:hypothetical protein RHGRI_021118 [Rhododendron griersonianum]
MTEATSRISYARICVEVDVQSVLPHSIDLITSSGRLVKINVKYPWRPLKCVSCKVFGHTECSQQVKAPLQVDTVVRAQVPMKNKVWVVKSGRPEVGMSVVPESSGVLVASKVPEVAVPCANQFLTLQNMEDLVSEVDRTEQGLPVDLGNSSSGLGVQRSSIMAMADKKMNWPLTCIPEYTTMFVITYSKKADSDELANGKKWTSEEQRNPEDSKNEREVSNEEATTGKKGRKRQYSSFLKKYIRGVKNRTPNEGLITVSADFKEPYPLCTTYERIASLILHLVITYVYNNFTWKRAMFTIGYKIRVESGEVSFTIGTAIHLNRSDSSGNALPNKEVFNQIWELIVKEGEIYRDNEILGVFLRVYIEKRIKKNKNKRISAYEVDSYINKLVLLENSMKDIGKTSGKVSMLRQRDSKSLYITALKPHTTELKPFIVADLETVLVESQNDDDYHVPYAAGLLPVHPGSNNSEAGILQGESFSISGGSRSESSMTVTCHFPHACTRLRTVDGSAHARWQSREGHGHAPGLEPEPKAELE